MTLPDHGHEPVMAAEVLRELGFPERASRRLVVMDCTVGRGGHAERIVRAMGGGAAGGGGIFIALDVDPANLKYARERLLAVGAPNVQIRAFHANFGEIGDVLDSLEIPGVDALLADFGVSTNQLLEGRHGLSFQADTKLDMRLDPRIDNTAADLLAEWDEKQIAQALQDYAQERFAWRIARKIVQTRALEPILTTGQLARLVKSVVPPPPRTAGHRRSEGGAIDPATRTFQALRMAVNEEPGHLADLLAAVPEIMNPAGRAVFLSFHSGEDRLVKQAVRQWEDAGLCRALTKKPLAPADDEMHANPRSRSAKLRAAEFSGNPPAGRDVRGTV